MSKKKKKKQQPPEQKRIVDAYSNPPARLGVGSFNFTETADYMRESITWDYSTLNTLYRESWIVQRIINTIPEDMTKNGYKIQSQMDPEVVKTLSRLERATGLNAQLLEGMQWGRLYGGAIGVIVIDGQEDMLSEPLEMDSVMPDSFKGLLIYDRWCGVVPSLELVGDAGDPDFGLPEYYTLTGTLTTQDSDYTGQRIHHSRVIRFTGQQLPWIERIAEQYWGASIVESIYQDLKKYDSTSYNIAALVFKACLRVYAIKDFELMGLTDEQAKNEFLESITALNWMMNNQGLQMIDGESRFETHQFSFTGLPDVLEVFMMDISGASQIPVTKLFGRSPAGMDATGESDLQNYYDSIEQKQESELRPIYDRLLPIMFMSAFGAVPDDFDYSFVSPRQPTEEERKNLLVQASGAVINAYNAGIINQRIALVELRGMSEQTGMFMSITDNDIESADTGFFAKGEIEAALSTEEDEPTPRGSSLPEPEESLMDKEEKPTWIGKLTSALRGNTKKA